MRRTIIVGVLVGSAVLVGSPVAAAPPEIGQRSCEADGGTFARVQGLKTCSQVSVAEVQVTFGELPYLNLDGPLITTPTASGYTENQLRGTTARFDMVRTTTTESQRGSGPVSTTTRRVIISSRVERLSCDLRTTDYDLAGTVLSSSYAPRPAEECAELDLFLTP